MTCNDYRLHGRVLFREHEVKYSISRILATDASSTTSLWL